MDRQKAALASMNQVVPDDFEQMIKMLDNIDNAIPVDKPREKKRKRKLSIIAEE